MLTILILLPSLGFLILLAGCEYVEPKRGEPGSITCIHSKPEARFGVETGTVLLGDMEAFVNSWSTDTIEAVVTSLPEGKYTLKVQTTAGKTYIITRGFQVEISLEEVCVANMRTVVSASHMYAAAHDGEYPGNHQQLIDEGFIEGPASHYDCPEGGEIEWNWNPGTAGGPPEPICSIHGSI